MEEDEFKWWYVLIIVPLWILGAWFNDYIRKNRNNFKDW